jgi:Ca-activated chloride channel family protein
LATVVAVGCWPEPPPVELRLYVSPDVWSGNGSLVLDEPIDRFNAEKIRASNGDIIRVVPEVVDSGLAEDYIARKPASAPDVWIPASAMWTELLADEQPSILGREGLELFTSSQVFAVWEPIAEAMGQGGLGWGDVLDYTRDREIWHQRVGESYGKFTLAHTNPKRSTSGLSAAVSEFYAASGSDDGTLSQQDIHDGRSAVHAIEQSIVHYGPTSGAILEQFECFGQSYATAAYLQESSIMRFNDGYYADTTDCPTGEEPHGDLTLFHPPDAKIVADYRCNVPRAEKSDALREEAASTFCSWLAEELHENPQHVEEHFFDPASTTDSIDPNERLAVPSGAVLQTVQEEWQDLRRAADVIIAIDTSQTMESELDGIKAELGTCLGAFTGDDRIGFLSFSEDVSYPVPLDYSDETQGAIVEAVQNLGPSVSGGTSLTDAIATSVRKIRRSYDRHRINGVVVITDGDGGDDPSKRSRPDVIEILGPPRLGPPRPVRIFLVEDGGTVDADFKNSILDASQGKAFQVPPTDAGASGPNAEGTPIAQVCDEVLSYF